MDLLSNASLILCVTFKTSAVELEKLNLYCLSLRMLLLLRWLTTSLMMIASKSLLLTMRTLMGCDKDKRSLTLVNWMYIWHLPLTWKICLLQVAVKLDWRKFGLWLLRTTTRILSRPVAFVKSSVFTSRKTSRLETEVSQSLYSVKWELLILLDPLRLLNDSTEYLGSYLSYDTKHFPPLDELFQAVLTPVHS